MNITRLIFFLLFFAAFKIAVGQGLASVYDDQDELLIQLKENKIYDIEGEILFSIRNNIVFRGDSYENEDLLFLIRSRDMFSRESGQVMSADMSITYYNMRRGNFYSGEHRTLDNELFSLEKTDKKTIDIYVSKSGNIAGKIKGEEFSNSELITMLVAIHFLRLKSEEESEAKEERPVNTDEPAGSTQREKTVIRPLWTMNPRDEWEWDGKVLKPRWSYNYMQEWVYDGRYIRPRWDPHPQEEWQWDGQFFQPAWRHIPEMQYIWEEGSLRPYWNYDADKEWVFTDTTAKPKWSENLRKEWVIEGDYEVPVPVLAIIVMGIAYR